MTESLEKQGKPSPADEQKPTERSNPLSQPRPRTAPEYAGYGLAFLSGCLVTLAVRYMLRGTSIQLSPESFVSLVFTVVVGAASLVLAIVAISYGRISERVMTERADRSIDIQMNLFQRSLDLQTQLFDKTMSTLESIGRSTGVTEQRLGDLHSLMQSPGFVKQIAGRAIEQTTSELSTSGKVGAQGGEFESHLAERLTKNIVEQLSARWESLTRPTPGLVNVPASGLSSSAIVGQTVSPTPPERSFDELVKEYQRKREVERVKNELQSLLQRAVASISEAALGRNTGDLGRLWEYTIKYKGKRSAIDLRIGPGSGDMMSYDLSIRRLFEGGVDSLIFLFHQAPDESLREHLEKRSSALGGRVRFIAAADERQLQNDLLAVLESVAAELPSAG